MKEGNEGSYWKITFCSSLKNRECASGFFWQTGECEVKSFSTVKAFLSAIEMIQFTVLIYGNFYSFVRKLVAHRRLNIQ